MSSHECRHDADVLAAVRLGRWPEGADPALVEHVAHCGACAEVVAIAAAFAEAEAEGGEPALPPAGVVWWRAQRQAREEALERATRPVRIAQWIAAACAAGLLAGVWTVAGAWLHPWVDWFAALLPSEAAGAAGLLGGTVPARAALVLAAIAAAVLAPAIIYLGYSDE